MVTMPCNQCPDKLFKAQLSTAGKVKLGTMYSPLKSNQKCESKDSTETRSKFVEHENKPKNAW